MTICIQDSPETGRQELGVKPNGKKWNNNTKYEPEFCDMVIEMGKKGATWAQMVSACGVGKGTAENWKLQFEEWANAVSAALAHSEAWWDSIGAANLEWVNSKGEPQIRSEIWKFQKQTVFGAKERQDSVIVNVTENADVDKVNQLVQKLHKEQI